MLRLKEIDFLRGIAVILVLFAHYRFTDFLVQIGWIGVDLFFVLSGFLVSTLLFVEYKKFTNIRSSLFLIRRGFKIYPTFYFFIFITVLILISLHLKGGSNQLLNIEYKLLAELLFVQNYTNSLWGHTWSLAVEEHFYIFLVILIYILIKFNSLENKRLFNYIFLSITIICLSLRVLTNSYLPFDFKTHLYPTHLRIDSLFFGVFLSYHYNFSKEQFFRLFTHYKKPLLSISAVLISVSFFFRVETFLISTIGLTFLFIGFGILLSLFICNETIATKLPKLLGRRLFDLVTTIGYYSYSIYLWHILVSIYGLAVIRKYSPVNLHYKVEFIIYFIVSIIAGVISSKIIELRFLNIRDKYFPKRTESPKQLQYVARSK